MKTTTPFFELWITGIIHSPVCSTCIVALAKKDGETNIIRTPSGDQNWPMTHLDDHDCLIPRLGWIQLPKSLLCMCVNKRETPSFIIDVSTCIRTVTWFDENL